LETNIRVAHVIANNDENVWLGAGLIDDGSQQNRYD
jgi:hypothetical protein